jgi:hypothetical protein
MVVDHLASQTKARTTTEVGRQVSQTRGPTIMEVDLQVRVARDLDIARDRKAKVIVCDTGSISFMLSCLDC